MSYYKGAAPFYWLGHGDGYAGQPERQCGTPGSFAESDYLLGHSVGARLAIVQRQEGKAQDAFDEAITSERLSDDPAHSRYAGRYMYMGKTTRER